MKVYIPHAQNHAPTVLKLFLHLETVTIPKMGDNFKNQMNCISFQFDTPGTLNYLLCKIIKSPVGLFIYFC